MYSISHLSCSTRLTFASKVFSFVPDISSAQSAANGIINLLDSVPEIDAESPEGKKPHNVEGHIRFENVHFCYPTRPRARVLRGLSLEVKPGTYIALVGASGCGKSTVYGTSYYCVQYTLISSCSIQLIERFYDPLAGHIYVRHLLFLRLAAYSLSPKLDDQPISGLNIQEYRKQIALVSQEPVCTILIFVSISVTLTTQMLYAGTIRFNILLGAIENTDEVTQEEIEAVCRDANILEFIQSLPE